jgi:hypothetical protein
MRSLEGLKKAASKQAGEDEDRQEEAGAASHPSFAI